MAAPSVMQDMALDALAGVRALVEEHASEERKARLQTYFTPAPAPRRELEHAAYTAELMAGLSEIVAKTAPRKRGRPRKAEGKADAAA